MTSNIHRLPWVGLIALTWVLLGFALVRAELKPQPIHDLANRGIEDCRGST